MDSNNFYKRYKEVSERLLKQTYELINMINISIDRFLIGYLRVPYALVNGYIVYKNPIIRITNYISENEELLIRASNLWATGYSRLSKKEKSKRLKKYYAEDVEISFLKICNRYKLKEPLNWLLKIDDKIN